MAQRRRRTVEAPRGGLAWNTEEDVVLDTRIRAGYSINSLTEIHERTSAAIHHRLESNYPELLVRGESFRSLPQDKSLAYIFGTPEISSIFAPEPPEVVIPEIVIPCDIKRSPETVDVQVMLTKALVAHDAQIKEDMKILVDKAFHDYDLRVSTWFNQCADTYAKKSFNTLVWVCGFTVVITALTTLAIVTNF